MDDLQKLIAEVAEGRHDDRLSDLLVAIRVRAEAAAIASTWRLEWDGLVVTEDDVTLDELATAEELSGKNWAQLNPKNSAVNCRSILIAALMHRKALSRAAAEKKVKRLTASAAVDCVSEEVRSPAPLGDSTDESTSDSEPGSPSASDGPPPTT